MQYIRETNSNFEPQLYNTVGAVVGYTGAPDAIAGARSDPGPYVGGTGRGIRTLQLNSISRSGFPKHIGGKNNNKRANKRTNKRTNRTRRTRRARRAMRANKITNKRTNRANKITNRANKITNKITNRANRANRANKRANKR